MKVSVCITVFNEEANIRKLLESLLEQSKKPDEIFIVDGGSRDRTVQIIKHYQKKDKRIKLIVEKGSCAHGRNVSIELAKNKIVAITDAGCIAKKDWLEKITYGFKHRRVKLIAGFYDMTHKNNLQKVINVYHGVPPKRFDPLTFIPSARSVAFRKSLWQDVGGFSEKLQKAGEDTLFFYECVKRGVKILRVKEARVVWFESATLSFKDSIMKFYQYALGDAQTKIWWHPSKRMASHNIKISMIFARYIVALALIILSFKYNHLFGILGIFVVLYLIWPIYKWFDVIKDWKSRILLPFVQIVVDICVMLGFIVGHFK